MNWIKVEKCNHENITDYTVWESCGTEYCSGSHEYHCQDCGIYFTDNCPCGDSGISLSGWPVRKWKNLVKKQEEIKKQRELASLFG